MPGKQAIGLRRPLPLGTKPWVHAEPFRQDLSPSDSDLIHSGWAGSCPGGPSKGLISAYLTGGQLRRSGRSHG
jgi:hypothetical protein